MYPVIRMLKEIVIARRRPPMGILEVNETEHICWPWDIDIFMELNNGRTLTLYDLGRIPMAIRMGFDKALKRQKWGLTIAGSSVRYRRRIRMFQKFRMKTRVIGWDERFIYIDQTMWRNGECTSQALLRSAITDRNGIVSPERFCAAVGADPQSPPLPAWVVAWIEAENTRVWPPVLPG
ncbi:hypothetical protein PSA7680_01332 [Pseudoruegeria aquimaris]|uniref:Thioesterase superfamily protein n=1 Tax=Pseudoruegeria aquimaris TaxID=393663 RepID=A0A1Y5RZ29_9RHOB|nr:acyl-CoA thioesterase [Pseudoruegeria aquimaris]SLN28984.1 hypothetical protein PSA7680_01332 [Pseudoruegeria aquimaris]